MFLLRLLTSPRLYWVYAKGQQQGTFGTGSSYVPNTAENLGQNICSWIKFFLELGLYSSPVLVPFFSGRIEQWRQNPRGLAIICLGVSAFYLCGLVIRAYGRFNNPVYREFAEVLFRARGNFPQSKMELARFDFDFSAWPVEFNATSHEMRHVGFPEGIDESSFRGITQIPIRFLGWLTINTFGLKMIYPGSTRWLVQNLIWPSLAENRAKLVAVNGGVRNKLATADGNKIDSMFFDRRSNGGLGNYLVICCEGNAGFYEIGMLTVPLEAGYSVVGWNHPGFWGSTGSPLPEQDTHAVDAVMQFATKKLGFPEDNIIAFGWSIGGFTASWLAMNYPNINSMILDATFDHVLPLAIPKMPAMLENVVKAAILHNVNLNVADQVKKFPGPIRLIRRTHDEMISTDDSQTTATNRANALLLKLLSHRYPLLFKDTDQPKEELYAYLTKDKPGQDEILSTRSVQSDVLLATLVSYAEEYSVEYPMLIGESYSIEEKVDMVLYLASVYMTEFDSTHCQPLPSSLFALPWQPLRKQ